MSKTMTASLDDRPATLGKTTFADTVIETLAGIAAREVPGVYKLGKGVLGDAVARVSGTSDTSRGVSAEVGQKEVAVDLELVVEYGYNIHEVAAGVRRLIGRRINEMTNLVAKEVNIAVVDIHYETDEKPASPRVE